MKNQNLGKHATDKVTGFSGVVVGFCQYLTGCDQYLLAPKTEDSTKMPESHWFDSNRIHFGKAVVVCVDTTQERGPDKPAPRY
jgi:hypothetical protein